MGGGGVWVVVGCWWWWQGGVLNRDAFISSKLKQIQFVLVLIVKYKTDLICFSIDHEILNRFDLI